MMVATKKTQLGLINLAIPLSEANHDGGKISN